MSIPLGIGEDACSSRLHLVQKGNRKSLCLVGNDEHDG